ncbi:hypothetical protein ABW19_dt0205101 [Dactylella cylindrospora]|nr:hypothetical protein ABW19_dt0205101 [Dactylella cylindrospora]
MRRPSVLNLIFALSLGDLVLARSISKRADLPVCAQPCFTAAVAASGCPANDATCICDSQSFYQSILGCILISCGYYDVANLLSFGLEFCNRTGVNSAARLNGVEKLESSIVEITPSPTPTLAPIPTSTPQPAPTPATETREIPSETPSPVSAPSVIEPSSVPEPSTASESPTASESSTLSEPVESEPETEAPTPSTKPIPSGQFTIAPPPATEDPDTQTVAIQTVNANPQTTLRAQTNPLAESSSAPPTPTADEPSSASASALHMFNQNSFNSFILCLITLLIVF